VTTYPKISIVTPSFNQGKYLEETILSVISQNYPNLEYIIIDGGSSDNSVEIIKKYEKYLSYWISEKDSGQSEAINKGIKKITGDVFNWLCSDDTLCPGSLHRIGKAFQEHPGLKCYAGGLHKFQGNETLEYYAPMLQGSLENTLRKRVVKQPSFFFSKVAIDSMGLLNEHLHYVMDADWLIKFLLLFGMDAVFEENDFVVANYRLHTDSKTITTIDKFTQEDASLLYSIAEHKGLKSYLYLLKVKKGTIENEFPKKLVENADRTLIEHLVFWFCLRKSTMIYEDTDFYFAKTFLSAIDTTKIELAEDELLCMEFLNKYVKNKSWFRYKISRAIEWRLKKQYLAPKT
jgi:glycosyltransferase involved in cell wall biosynthesis